MSQVCHTTFKFSNFYYIFHYFSDIEDRVQSAELALPKKWHPEVIPESSLTTVFQGKTESSEKFQLSSKIDSNVLIQLNKILPIRQSIETTTL